MNIYTKNQDELLYNLYLYNTNRNSLSESKQHQVISLIEKQEQVKKAQEIVQSPASIEAQKNIAVALVNTPDTFKTASPELFKISQQIQSLKDKGSAGIQQIEALLKQAEPLLAKYLQAQLSQQASSQQTNNESLDYEELQEAGFLSRTASRLQGALKSIGSNLTAKQEAILVHFQKLQKSLGTAVKELQLDMATTSKADPTVKNEVDKIIAEIESVHKIAPSSSKLQQARHYAGQLTKKVVGGAALLLPLKAVALPAVAALGLKGAAGWGAATLANGMVAGITSMAKDLVSGQSVNVSRAAKASTIGVVASIGSDVLGGVVSKIGGTGIDTAIQAKGDAAAEVAQAKGQAVADAAQTKAQAGADVAQTKGQAAADAAQTKAQAGADAAQTKAQAYSAKSSEDLKSHIEELNKEAKSYSAKVREYRQKSFDYDESPENQAYYKDLAKQFEEKANSVYKQIIGDQDRVFELSKLEKSLADKMELQRHMELEYSKAELKVDPDYAKMLDQIKDIQSKKEILLKGTVSDTVETKVQTGADAVQAKGEAAMDAAQTKTQAYSAKSPEDLKSHNDELRSQAQDYADKAREMRSKALTTGKSQYNKLADDYDLKSKSAWKEYIADSDRFQEIEKLNKLEAEEIGFQKDLEKDFSSKQLQKEPEYIQSKQDLKDIQAKKEALLKGPAADASQTKGQTISDSSSQSKLDPMGGNNAPPDLLKNDYVAHTGQKLDASGNIPKEDLPVAKFLQTVRSKGIIGTTGGMTTPSPAVGDAFTELYRDPSTRGLANEIAKKLANMSPGEAQEMLSVDIRKQGVKAVKATLKKLVTSNLR